MYSHLSVSSGDWFQETLQISKSTDAQVPYIKGGHTVGPPHPWLSHPHTGPSVVGLNESIEVNLQCGW